MKDLFIQLNDLPDEILIYIFKKLYNGEVLYSLMGVNQRFDRILHDTIFTRNLCLLEYCPVDDATFPFPDAIIDRFCSKILPEIGHQIQTLFLSRTSIERVLYATNYPNLNHLGLCDIEYKVARSLLADESPLTDMFKNQISSLFINLSDEDDLISTGAMTSAIFNEIFNGCTNLQCLKINPYLFFRDTVNDCMTHRTSICSTLLELHVRVSRTDDCLYILDGRFDQLRKLYVTCEDIFVGSAETEHKQKLLPNLRIFSLCCKRKMFNYDGLIVPLLRRMLNLEELDLNITVYCDKKIIDGDILKKDILIYMPQLYKFTFNICLIINHHHKIKFPSNEHIQNTFKNISTTQIITSIEHFQGKQYGRCHIYSYPYKWKIYKNLTNNFRGGLFTSVTQVSLYDERPFEYKFFLQIAQSFPFMKELKIKNQKAQKYKQRIKSSNNNQILSVIEYPNLTRLDFSKIHDDYLELFLFDTNVSLPTRLHLYADYQSLKRVTYHFTRYITRNHCAKLAALYIDSVDQIDENIKNYFPHTCIRWNSVYRLKKYKSSHTCSYRYMSATTEIILSNK
ncbi:unnamed protein product [Rotaria sp. Silwood1]|nr:unnamed protein product [Rotaria sp. Silwood1]